MFEEKQTVKVIFRTWPDGVVEAAFPERIGNNNGTECETWQNTHDGGAHFTAGISDLVQLTRPATDNEAGILSNILLGYYGYEIVRIYRESPKMRDRRNEALRLRLGHTYGTY